MDTSKEKMTGIAGTIGIHLILLLFLLFYYITPKLSRSSEELEGVPVMFGNVQDAVGNDEPRGRAETPAPNQEDVATANQVSQPKDVTTPAKEVKPTPAEVQKTTTVKNNNIQNVHSQDAEETVALAAAKKAAAEKARQESLAAEKLRKEQAEARRIEQEKAQRSAAIKSQMSGVFGNGSGKGSRGEGTGKGTQGVPTGNSNHGKTSGVGGTGTYDLGGRGVGSGGLVLPSYDVDDYGKVVIDIVVDPRGNVVEAIVGKGTNTPSSSLRNAAERAAKRTKFTSVNTPGNQKGTITYKFNLN
ncbi:MAG: hypothetical protein H6Q14_1009 [Bacteroidetes bacterium]|nr:hypothetical protein [Bacteroidota bacterium]